MKINLKDFKWTNVYKNITINDKKKMITMFDGKYLQFLKRHKGNPINSKQDLIKILNRKPRSFLTTLNVWVRTLKYFNNQLIRNILSKSLHPLNMITTSKKALVKSLKSLKHVKSLKLFPTNENLLSSPLLKNKIFIELNEKKLDAKVQNILNTSKYIKKLDIINNKINQVKKSLYNNNLSIPIDLLKPLSKINKIYLPKFTLWGSKLETFGLIGKSLINKEIEIKRYNKNDKLDITKFIANSNNPLWINIVKNGIQKSYKPIIKRFKNLILEYHKNNINNITPIKYFQLITPYKYVNPFHQNIKYNFNKDNNEKFKNIYTLLEYAFKSMSCLISKPVFMETSNTIIINLFYFFVPGKVNKQTKLHRLQNLKNITVPIATSLNGIEITNSQLINKKKNNKNKSKKKNTFKYFLNPNNFIKINKLCTILSRIFNKSVELELTPLKLPFFDDNILVKAIGIMSKKVSVRTFFNFIYRKTILYSKRTAHYQYRYSITRSFLAGIKIKIGGRLMTQPLIPKKSSRTLQRGAIAQGKVNFVDWSRINLKNRRGAHSITVTMSHVM